MFSFSGLVSAYLYFSAQVSVQVSAHFYTFQRILQVAFSPLWLLFKLICSSFFSVQKQVFQAIMAWSHGEFLDSNRKLNHNRILF